VKLEGVSAIWRAKCLIHGMLRITVHESAEAVKITLEGRIAGPWAEEFDRVWVETAPRLGSRRLLIDLSEVTYADADGKRVLSKILSQAKAELVTGTLWTQYLAEEVTGRKASSSNREG
jgi:hypothetical protein